MPALPPLQGGITCAGFPPLAKGGYEGGGQGTATHLDEGQGWRRGWTGHEHPPGKARERRPGRPALPGLRPWARWARTPLPPLCKGGITCARFPPLAKGG